MIKLNKDNLLPAGTLVVFNKDYGLEAKKNDIGLVLDHPYPLRLELLIGEKLVTIFFSSEPRHQWVSELSVFVPVGERHVWL